MLILDVATRQESNSQVSLIRGRSGRGLYQPGASPRRGRYSLARHVSAGRACAIDEAGGRHYVAYLFGKFRSLCVLTKNRVNSIPTQLLENLWAYLLGIANNLKIKALAIGELRIMFMF